MLLKSREEQGIGIIMELIEDEGKRKINAKEISMIGEYKFSLPVSVQLAATNKCNLDCKYCYAKDDVSCNRKDMDYNEFIRVIDMLDKNNIMILSWSGGEPFYNESFIKILEYAGEKGFIQSIISNGLLINERHMKVLKKYDISLQISLNEIFEKDNKKALESLIVASKLTNNNITTSVDIVLDNIDLTNFDSLLDLLCEKGILNVKCGPLIPTGKIEDNVNLLEYRAKLIPFIKKINEYRKEYKGKIDILTQFDKEVNLNKIFTKRVSLCEAAIYLMYIDNNGDVYPCPLFKNKPEFYCGNILRESFIDIWNSEVMNKLRDIKIEDTKCDKCEYTCGVWCRGLVCNYTNNLYSHSPFCDLTLEVIR